MKTTKTMIAALLLATLSSAFRAEAKNVLWAVLEDGTLTFSYGLSENKPDGAYGANPGSGEAGVPWRDVRSEITRVVFDESTTGYEVGSVEFYFIFAGCSNLVSVEGLGRLDVSNASNMGAMFQQCSKLVEVDFSRWVNSKANFQVFNMFQNCTALTKIYVSDAFAPEYKTGSNTAPFTWSSASYSCKGLSGGNGTVYNTGNKSVAWACIDRPGTNGYFTGRCWIDVELDGGSGVDSTHYELTGTAFTQPQTVAMGVPLKTGYDFTGWTLPQEQIEDGVTADAITGGITVPADYLKTFTVTANWAVHSDDHTGTYTISYYLGNEKYDGKDEEYDYDAENAYVLRFADPQVSIGKSFAGWYLDSELQNGPVTAIAAGTYGNLAVYAAETNITATTFEWNGSVDGDFSNGRNWTPNKVPGAGDTIVIPAAPEGVTNVIVLTSAPTVSGIVLDGDVTFDVPSDLTLNKAISGSGNVTKTGAGRLKFSAANSFTGSVIVAVGSVERGTSSAFGAVSNTVALCENTVLDNGGYDKSNVGYHVTLAEGAMIVYGNTQGYSGIISVSLSGDAAVSNGTVQATAPTLASRIQFNGHVLSKLGAGNIACQLANTAADDTGTVRVVGGLLRNNYTVGAEYVRNGLRLEVAAGAEFFNSQRFVWGGIKGESGAAFSFNSQNSSEYRLRVSELVEGTVEVTNLLMQAGCVYRPLALADRISATTLTLSDTIDLDLSAIVGSLPSGFTTFIETESDIAPNKISLVNAPGKILRRIEADGVFVYGLGNYPMMLFVR